MKMDTFHFKQVRAKFCIYLEGRVIIFVHAPTRIKKSLIYVNTKYVLVVICTMYEQEDSSLCETN